MEYMEWLIGVCTNSVTFREEPLETAKKKMTAICSYPIEQQRFVWTLMKDKEDVSINDVLKALVRLFGNRKIDGTYTLS